MNIGYILSGAVSSSKAMSGPGTSRADATAQEAKTEDTPNKDGRTRGKSFSDILVKTPAEKTGRTEGTGRDTPLDQEPHAPLRWSARMDGLSSSPDTSSDPDLVTGDSRLTTDGEEGASEEAAAEAAILLHSEPSVKVRTPALEPPGRPTGHDAPQLEASDAFLDGKAIPAPQRGEAAAKAGNQHVMVGPGMAIGRDAATSAGAASAQQTRTAVDTPHQPARPAAPLANNAPDPAAGDVARTGAIVAGGDAPKRDTLKPGGERQARQQPVGGSVSRPTDTAPVPGTPRAEAAVREPQPQATTIRGAPAEQPRALRAASDTNAAPDRIEPKVTVLSTQIAPAPLAAPPASLSQTGTAFLAVLKSENALPPHAAEAVSQALDRQSVSARPVTMLKFQLHPAELGTVTVKLTGSGDQLAIEVQVESAEARQKLSTDSEAIVKALRGMGYEIDRITVQQAPSPAASQGGAPDRGSGFAAQDGRTGERHDQPRQQESGQRDDQHARGNPATGTEAPGGGVYI